MKARFFLLALALSCSSFADEWENAARVKFSGDLVSMDDRAIVFQVDGKNLAMPFATLSPATIARAREKLDFPEIPAAILATYRFAREKHREAEDRLANKTLAREAFEKKSRAIREAFLVQCERKGVARDAANHIFTRRIRSTDDE